MQINISETLRWSGVSLEILILWRSIHGKFFAKYPFFYTYLATVSIVSTADYIVSKFFLPHSMFFYWSTQIATLVMGCGVMWEIIRHVLSPHPGPGRFVRLFFVMIFGMIFLIFAVHALFLPQWMPAKDVADLERDLRIAQALVLCALVFIIRYYGIDIGRNSRGMVLGYGQYVAISLITLTLHFFIGVKFNHTWIIVQPGSYIVALCIWMVTLWSYEPNPVPKSPELKEAEYQSLIQRARDILKD